HVDIVKLFHDLPPELWHWVDKGFAPINLTHVCQVGRSSIMSTKSHLLKAFQDKTSRERINKGPRFAGAFFLESPVSYTLDKPWHNVSCTQALPMPQSHPPTGSAVSRKVKITQLMFPRGKRRSAKYERD
ncbi:hypothetical protein, partial [Limnohabitans sp. 2KL-51]|uniref:hypothetical protein n=1 Tax=Limnohabitans sp. 2KL-51 TaxID=1977911 RepID=UPI001E644B7D